MTARRRAVLASGAAAAILLAALGPAGAKPVRARQEHAKNELPPKLEQPIIAISIADQRLTLYDKGVPVAHAPVSTGMPGHSTPMGIFSVIQKQIFHRSNIYSGAPMPYMQRITWSGVALHAGVLPGHPASHGCIRMPPEFAVRLYRMTQRGARVVIARNQLTPVPFEDPRLFTGLKAATEKTSELPAPPRAADSGAVVNIVTVRTAETAAPAVMSDAADAAAHARSGADKPQPAPQTVKLSEMPAGPAKDAAATPAQDATVKPDAVVTAGAPKPVAQDTSQAGAEPAPPTGGAATGTVTVKPIPVVAPEPIEVKKSFEPANPAQTTTTLTPAVAPASDSDAALEPYGPERPLRPGPITVFVSKKESKLFVRKGFQPVFSSPVTIEHPEQPLGTHLFTAVEAQPDGVSFRWLEMSIAGEAARKAEVRVTHDRYGRRIEKVIRPAVVTPSATAAEALARVEIPPAALARISGLMSAGASLIISDQGLGSETGSETDFIVVTR